MTYAAVTPGLGLDAPWSCRPGDAYDWGTLRCEAYSPPPMDPAAEKRLCYEFVAGLTDPPPEDAAWKARCLANECVDCPWTDANWDSVRNSVTGPRCVKLGDRLPDGSREVVREAPAIRLPFCTKETGYLVNVAGGSGGGDGSPFPPMPPSSTPPPTSSDVEPPPAADSGTRVAVGWLLAAALGAGTYLLLKHFQVVP